MLEGKEDYSGAKMAYRQALTASVGLYGEKHLDTASTRIKLGRVLVSEQEYDAAEEEFRKAVSAREESLGSEDLLKAEAYSLLGTVLSRKGDFEGALAEHQKALAIRQEQLGESHADVIASKKHVADASEGKQEDEIEM